MLLLITSTAGGVGLHVYYLAKYLPRDEFQVTVGFGPGEPMDAQIAGLGVPVIHFGISRRLALLTNLRAFFQVLRVLRDGEFDIICSECSIAGFIGRLAGWISRVPVRIFVIQLYASHPQQSAFKRVVYRWLERWLDRFTTRYIAVSEATKRFGVENRIIDASKVDVIYNSVEMPTFQDADQTRVRHELGVPTSGFVIGTLARFDRQKALDVMIRAAAVARNELEEITVLLAGDGPLRAELATTAQHLGIGECVHFLGWRHDITRVLSAMDVYCLSSLWEALPFALVEAMAMGIPIVATNVDGVPEVVVHGETGLLVPPREHEAMGQAIVTLFRDPKLRTQMSGAAWKRARRTFSADVMVRRYASIFRDSDRQRSTL